MIPHLINIVAYYGISDRDIKFEILQNGLINQTWKVSCLNKHYILQKLNENVFPHPELIDNNIRLINDYIQKNSLELPFVSPCIANNGQTLIKESGLGFFRLFPYVEGSRSYQVAESPKLAFEAARQFGKFASVLKDFPSEQLAMVLPDFHNLRLRYNQFKQAHELASLLRRKEASQEIKFVEELSWITKQYDSLVEDDVLKKGVFHHDTKISNVLFNDRQIGICVIDLDTIMQGYFISDLGDMMRTYLCAVSEEEMDLNKVTVRIDYFEAIVGGYLEQMGEFLTRDESRQIIFSGKFMIYMQALRFLADYLNGDIYYFAKYEAHNLVRARNQLQLLKSYLSKELELQAIVNKHLLVQNNY